MSILTKLSDLYLSVRYGKSGVLEPDIQFQAADEMSREELQNQMDKELQDEQDYAAWYEANHADGATCGSTFCPEADCQGDAYETISMAKFSRDDEPTEYPDHDERIAAMYEWKGYAKAENPNLGFEEWYKLSNSPGTVYEELDRYGLADLSKFSGQKYTVTRRSDVGFGL